MAIEEVTNGKRRHVSDEWLDTTQTDYVEVTHILIDAGLVSESEAHADGEGISANQAPAFRPALPLPR